MRKLDLVGQKFGRLTVLSRTENAGAYTAFVCRCECGEECVKPGYLLKRGTRSCGCLQGHHQKHGMSRTKIYKVWSSMLERCADLNNVDYGGRGIRVCERWHQFENFLADMGDRPTPDHEIDRVNNDGNYEPDNCRWATREEQQRNTRHNRRLTHQGETLTVTEWAERVGIKRGILFNRLLCGWSIEKTLMTPVRRYANGSKET